jgi:hypothetical protein
MLFMLPYKKTTVSMTAVNPYIASLHVPAEVKRAAYIIFRIESANGSKGVNSNFVGAQADSGRWQKELDADCWHGEAEREPDRQGAAICGLQGFYRINCFPY